MARLWEQLDFISNAKKEDNIIIMGLMSKSRMATSCEEKRTWIHKIVGEILDKIVSDSSKHDIFFSLDSRNSRVKPFLEVKLDSRELKKNFG
jgi:hypothetical protein